METAGGGVQLSDSFTRTLAMDTTVPRISIEFTTPLKEKVIQNGRHSLICFSVLLQGYLSFGMCAFNITRIHLWLELSYVVTHFICMKAVLWAQAVLGPSMALPYHVIVQQEP